MTTPNLLVELFVEELPPKALKKLGEAFAGTLFEQLKAQGLTAADSVVAPYASPRRLAAHITRVAAKAADKSVQQKLMPVSVALDAAGQPTPALLKKLQAVGADPSVVPQLQRAMDGKAEALFLDTLITGATLDTGLQKALNEAIGKLPIPKVMTYQLQEGTPLPGWDSVQFVRPAHGLVALHGSNVVPVTALGLQAGRATHGHRFEAVADPIAIVDADRYADTLRDKGAVIASFDERRAAIVSQLESAAAQAGQGLCAIEDEALLDEVTALVERPNVMVCQFEPEFLAVPQECLILTMKANQKYFPLLDAAGKLTHQFLIVSNISPKDASAVIEGNERVVRPRLADAKFFFDQDRKKTLESRVPQLAKVVYHNKLGTQGERTERVRAIARAIGDQLKDALLADKADQAAALAKADLLTDMVGEFPELQGVMGGYYARHDGLTEDIAFAIEDHYKPRFAGDELPRGQVGTVVALADKLETLVGMFGIGNLPTGDKDPFALRRHALGVIRMLVEKKLPLNLTELLGSAAQRFGALLPDAAKSNEQLLTFIHERVATYLRDQGYSAQEADAVIAARPMWGEMPKALDAVRAFAQLPEAPALAAANKRIGNILKKAEAEGAVDAHVNPALLTDGAERALYDAMQQTVPGANAQFDAGDYTASLQTLSALRAPVDAFFDDVMVNAEQTDVRLNRLGLLKTLHQAMNRVADLSRLAA
ncbi:glycine--tRNA ligase subunit beta [Ottowia sp.]|uniref:glycine--tRNA ligase subunit beta n=1 Tax=Ottowia sp. TaxID=1898956 RepID=UPI002C26F63D|nr:glycine--tRNA ligase subunit beta [Ottowia sp.]HOB65109.1 glycine--tRNA ligase subunit beta [Ottowia sp.]HPZ56256.1 glycine--tRNA ligase subunit beta [Ottowia sp.]HQD46578.1 glycine--tRNA ligase subunit beta [Ottowia sp.]